LHKPSAPAEDTPAIDRRLIDQCDYVYRTCMTTLADWCPCYGLQQEGEAEQKKSRVA
jgi:hypothetical protein